MSLSSCRYIPQLERNLIEIQTHQDTFRATESYSLNEIWPTCRNLQQEVMKSDIYLKG